MKIWNKEFSLDDLNKHSNKTLGHFLGIEFTEIGDNYIVATMPVNDRTKQPAGLLHGGASVVLAETLGSVASHCVIDTEKFQAVGLEINANHLRPVFSGSVIGICTPIHIGNKTHVWEIKMYKGEDKLNCISRLTVSIIPKMEKE